MTTIQDFLNLATPTSSPKHGNTNIYTFQPSKTFSTIDHQHLHQWKFFHTPPTSPHPLLETFENLSPKPSSPPSLSLFDTIAETETQQQPIFQPNESLDDVPHPPSLLESLAYRYARP
jgi:hypothetical protein